MNGRYIGAAAFAALSLAAVPATAGDLTIERSRAAERLDARVLAIQAAKAERVALARTSLSRAAGPALLPAPGGVLTFL